jgi:hypothetical protein
VSFIVNITLQNARADVERLAVNQCHYYATRLQLQSYYFFDLSDINCRQLGLIRTYNTAVAYLERLLDEDRSVNLLLYCPYELLRTFWLAMSVISDILRSPLASKVDHKAGPRLFHAGIAGARKASVENNDIPGRLSVIMAQLWRKRNAKLDFVLEVPKLRIKSRLGASNVYNWLWYWRENFAGQADAYEGSQCEWSISPLNIEANLPSFAGNGFRCQFLCWIPS